MVSSFSVYNFESSPSEEFIISVIAGIVFVNDIRSSGQRNVKTGNPIRRPIRNYSTFIIKRDPSVDDQGSR